MMNKSRFLLLLFIALLVSSCRLPESGSKPVSTSEETVNINIGKVIRSGEFEQRAETEILPQNNCDNKSPISFSVSRERTLEQSVDLTLQGELGGELGAEMVGKIVATIGAEYGQSSRKSISDSGGMEFTIEPGDFPNYTIVWREKWEKGYITVQYDDEEREIPYLYLTTARPELVNVEYNICPTLSEEILPATSEPISTRMVENCLPQTGWTPPKPTANGEWIYDCLSSEQGNWVAQSEEWKAANWRRGSGQSEIVNIVVPQKATTMGIGCNPCTIIAPNGTTFSPQCLTESECFGSFKPNAILNVNPGEVYKAQIFGSDSCPTRTTVTPPCAPEIYIWFNLP